MKRNLISGFIMALCAIAMVSCQKDENDPSTKEFKSFSATVEQSNAKTAINIVGNDTLICWSDDDAISLISTNGGTDDLREATNNDELNISDFNNTTATFSGDVTTGSNGRHIAIYPYDEYAISSDGNLSGIQTSIPALQSAVAGSFDPKANIMVASAANNETSFAFKHACAYLKIHSPYTCSSIQIISNGSSMIAGTFTVDVATDGTPSNFTSLDETNGGSKYIRLTGNIQANQDYYIAILPGTINGGFTIKFCNNDITYKASTTNNITLVRGYVYPLEGFSITTETNTVPTGAVDLGLPSGTLWATSNVDATCTGGFAQHAYDFGSFFHFGITTAYSSSDVVPSSVGNSPIVDAATNYCGSSWKTPTAANFYELYHYCTMAWGSNNGVDGFTFTGANGNTIFLPAAGNFMDARTTNQQNFIHSLNNHRYWTITNIGDNYYFVNFDHEGNTAWGEINYCEVSRAPAFPIRPVVND